MIVNTPAGNQTVVFIDAHFAHQKGQGVVGNVAVVNQAHGLTFLPLTQVEFHLFQNAFGVVGVFVELCITRNFDNVCFDVFVFEQVKNFVQIIANNIFEEHNIMPVAPAGQHHKTPQIVRRNFHQSVNIFSIGPVHFYGQIHGRILDNGEFGQIV